MDELDEMKQGTIANLKGQLCMEEIITVNGDKLHFYDDGKFVLNNSKIGSYQIFFTKELTLFLISNDNFAFKANAETTVKGISLLSLQNYFDVIFDQIKNLRIEFIA
jgi:hypothetical protein